MTEFLKIQSLVCAMICRLSERDDQLEIVKRIIRFNVFDKIDFILTIRFFSFSAVNLSHPHDTANRADKSSLLTLFSVVLVLRMSNLLD